MQLRCSCGNATRDYDADPRHFDLFPASCVKKLRLGLENKELYKSNCEALEETAIIGFFLLVFRCHKCMNLTIFPKEGDRSCAAYKLEAGEHVPAVFDLEILKQDLQKGDMYVDDNEQLVPLPKIPEPIQLINSVNNVHPIVCLCGHECSKHDKPHWHYKLFPFNKLMNFLADVDKHPDKYELIPREEINDLQLAVGYDVFYCNKQNCKRITIIGNDEYGNIFKSVYRPEHGDLDSLESSIV